MQKSFHATYILTRSERKWFKRLRSLRGQAIGFISANKNLPCGYPHELWYRYMPESGNWHGGTFTRWIAALPAAPQIPACGTTALGSCLRSDAETLIHGTLWCPHHGLGPRAVFAASRKPVQFDRRCFQPLRAGHGRLNTVPLGRRPFLHKLRRWLVTPLA